MKKIKNTDNKAKQKAGFLRHIQMGSKYRGVHLAVNALGIWKKK